MNQYIYLTPELHELIKRDIDSVLNEHLDDTERSIEELKLKEEESIQLIINGVQQMQQHININKEMPAGELIERLQSINHLAKGQETIDLNDLSLTFAAFLLTIDCDFLGHKLHTENVLLDCQKMFERAQQDLILQISIKESLRESGKLAVTERFKGQDKLVSLILEKWMNDNKPNIFHFVQDNYEYFYKLSPSLNAKVKSLEQMYKLIQDWLEAFNNLLNDKYVGRPRKSIVELAKKYTSTAL